MTSTITPFTVGTQIFPVPLEEFTLDGLDPSLHEFVNWDGHFGPVFDHPLYRDTHLRITAAMPEREGWPDKTKIVPAGLKQINEIIEFQSNLLKEFENARRWQHYVFTYHRPYRVDALLRVVERVGASKLWPLVGYVWHDSESNMQSADEWNEIWSRAYDRHGDFRKCFRKVMGAADRRIYDGLPTMITAYRGCFDENDTMAYSWTLNRETAEWFARRKRFHGAPVVAKVKVHKSFVLAYFGSRNESELVLDYTQGLDYYDMTFTELEPEMREAA